MLIFLKSINSECGLFSTRPVMTFNLPPANQLTWLKRESIHLSYRKDGLIGQVTIGNRQQPICIPQKFCYHAIQRCTLTNSHQGPHAWWNKQNIIIYCLALWLTNGAGLCQIARAIPIILINTNKFNAWVRQPLLAAKLYDADCDQTRIQGNNGLGGRKHQNWVSPCTSSAN